VLAVLLSLVFIYFRNSDMFFQWDCVGHFPPVRLQVPKSSAIYLEIKNKKQRSYLCKHKEEMRTSSPLHALYSDQVSRPHWTNWRLRASLMMDTSQWCFSLMQVAHHGIELVTSASPGLFHYTTFNLIHASEDEHVPLSPLKYDAQTPLHSFLMWWTAHLYINKE